MSDLFRHALTAHSPVERGDGISRQTWASTPDPGLWKLYFETKEQLEVKERSIIFNYYRKGQDGAVILCLHGGGYTGLTWSLFAQRLCDAHKCQVIAPDLRGHGETTSLDDLDLSASTLAQDVCALYKGLDLPSKTPLVAVGHSMGGSIAVRAAQLLSQDSACALAGVAVIDVVEGTALAALPSMRGVLATRPAMFDSIPNALTWARSAHMASNKEAASVSLPSMLVWKEKGASSSSFVGHDRGLEPISESTDAPETLQAHRHAPKGTLPPRHPHQPASSKPHPTGGWIWRTALAESAQYWEGWYQGLSDAFLSLPCPKILILAGTDRLDKPLTIGQMQGKFQLALLPQSGHAIQEDAPAQVAETISGFLKRFRVGEGGLAFHSRLGA